MAEQISGRSAMDTFVHESNLAIFRLQLTQTENEAIRLLSTKQAHASSLTRARSVSSPRPGLQPIDPQQRQYPLKDRSETDQDDEQLEKTRQPAVIHEFINHPEADRSDDADDENADEHGNHDLHPPLKRHREARRSNARKADIREGDDPSRLDSNQRKRRPTSERPPCAAAPPTKHPTENCELRGARCNR